MKPDGRPTAGPPVGAGLPAIACRRQVGVVVRPGRLVHDPSTALILGGRQVTLMQVRAAEPEISDRHSRQRCGAVRAWPAPAIPRQRPGSTLP